MKRGRGAGRWKLAPRIALALWGLVGAGPCAARTLEEALVSTFRGQLSEDAHALSRVFADAVAASFPVTGASAPYVYRFDPATDSFERLRIPLGPVFSERAETIGRHKLSVSLNYALIQYDGINGHDLHALASNDPRSSEAHLAICTTTFCEPVAGMARLDLEAQIVTLSAIYGLTSDLDIDLSLPLVRTFLRASTAFIAPDPRAPPDPRYVSLDFGGTASETSTGVGDVLLRLKYAVGTSEFADVAAGLTLSLPTGERADFHGTGDTLAGLAIYLSHTYGERVEPHVNLGFVLDADTFDRSQVRYAAGADVRLLDWLTLNTDFLGRSDVAQPDSIDHPAFVQIERNDVLQFSTGLKVSPLQRTIVFFNALLPLSDEGLHSDRVLAGGVEWVF